MGYNKWGILGICSSLILTFTDFQRDILVKLFHLRNCQSPPGSLHFKFGIPMKLFPVRSNRIESYVSKLETQSGIFPQQIVGSIFGMCMFRNQSLKAPRSFFAHFHSTKSDGSTRSADRQIFRDMTDPTSAGCSGMVVALRTFAQAFKTSKRC